MGRPAHRLRASLGAVSQRQLRRDLRRDRAELHAYERRRRSNAQTRRHGDQCRRFDHGALCSDGHRAGRSSADSHGPHLLVGIRHTPLHQRRRLGAIVVAEPACSDPDWNMEGVYYSVTDPDKQTRVLRQDASGVDSTGTWPGWVHDPLTVDGSKWGTRASRRHRRQARSLGLAGPVDLLLGRRAEDLHGTSRGRIRDEYLHDRVGDLRRVGPHPEEGVGDLPLWAGLACCRLRRRGTWYLLAQARPGAPSFGTWHTFSAIKRDNADGFVTLIGLRDGVELLRYTEQPNDLPLGPLRGGREGWRDRTRSTGGWTPTR